MAVLLPIAERLARAALRRRGARTRWVTSKHGRVHVYDATGRGDLPPVVLLHGLGSAATSFGPFFQRLRPHVRRVVAPDYPGHGFSGKSSELTPDALFESVEEVVGALVTEPAVLVGNSLGGAVALHFAISHPERVRALVLVSPAGAPSSEDEWKELRSTFALESRGDARTFIDRLYHRPPWFMELVAHEFPHLMARPAVKDILRTGTNEDLASPDDLRALRMPILFLWGESEQLLPDSHLAYFREHLPPHAIIERPRGFGHCPHLDDPAALASRVVGFLRESVA